MPNDTVNQEIFRTPIVESGIRMPLSLSREFSEVLQPARPEDIRNPVMELLNTRLLLIDQFSRTHKTQMKIDMVSREEWKKLFEDCDIVWFMGIYPQSQWSRQIAIKYSYQYLYALPDLDSQQDVVGSPFAIPDYTPNPKVAADWNSWDKMFDKLHTLKKKVIIDFVPNHTAVDHPWARTHPEYYIQGTQVQYDTNPSLYHKVDGEDGKTYYLAHGKDPNFPEWSDTLQLNYANPTVQVEMKKILLDLTKHTDGVRCDMAMLLNIDTFLRTWGSHLTEEEKNYIRENNFWEKTIPEVKEKAKALRKDDFLFIAEAYEDKDKKILGNYFDYIYGKDFYDHLKRIVVDQEKPEGNLRAHVFYLLTAAKKERFRRLLFTENHDEERAVKVFGEKPAMAAAALTGFLPGEIFLLNGDQEKGPKIRPPMQIGRLPYEVPDENSQRFYKNFFRLKRSKLFQEGDYKLANLITDDDGMIVIQVTMKHPVTSRQIGAIVCVNFSNTLVTGRLCEIGKDTNAQAYRLAEGDFVNNPDVDRVGGMYIQLSPWETQIIFYTDT